MVRAEPGGDQATYCVSLLKTLQPSEGRRQQEMQRRGAGQGCRMEVQGRDSGQGFRAGVQSRRAGQGFMAGVQGRVQGRGAGQQPQPASPPSTGVYVTLRATPSVGMNGGGRRAEAEALRC